MKIFGDDSSNMSFNTFNIVFLPLVPNFISSAHLLSSLAPPPHYIGEKMDFFPLTSSCYGLAPQIPTLVIIMYFWHCVACLTDQDLANIWYKCTTISISSFFKYNFYISKLISSHNKTINLQISMYEIFVHEKKTSEEKK